MKTVLIALIAIWFVSADWLTSMDEAKTQAAKEGKMILLNFSGSDWCAPCIQLKRNVFESESFKQFADQNLVLLRADFPRLKKNQLEKSQVQQNELLAEKYNPQGKFPFTVLLYSNGNVVREWDGYNNQAPEEFVAQLNKSIPK